MDLKAESVKVSGGAPFTLTRIRMPAPSLPRPYVRVSPAGVAGGAHVRPVWIVS